MYCDIGSIILYAQHLSVANFITFFSSPSQPFQAVHTRSLHLLSTDYFER